MMLLYTRLFSKTIAVIMLQFLAANASELDGLMLVSHILAVPGLKSTIGNSSKSQEHSQRTTRSSPSPLGYHCNVFFFTSISSAFPIRNFQPRVGSAGGACASTIWVCRRLSALNASCIYETWVRPETAAPKTSGSMLTVTISPESLLRGLRLMVCLVSKTPPCSSACVKPPRGRFVVWEAPCGAA